MGDRGYAAVLALAMLFGGVLLIGLASDVARLAATWQEASHVAHVAAEAGAGWVEPDGLYEGVLVLDQIAARDASEQYLDSHGLEGVVEVDLRRVCVTVRASVEPGLIRIIGASPKHVEVQACAEPRQG